MKIQKKYDIYFFDFFGTIMHRKCSGDDIKKIWAVQMALRYGNTLDSKQWYNLRIASEQCICKKENHFEFTFEELNREIYNRLQNMRLGYRNIESFEHFYEISIKTEIKIEISMQEKNAGIISTIKMLKSCGKIVYILSDFYLGSEYLLRFLEEKGESDLVDKIFVSCEFKKNKADGSIYKEVLELLDCNPNLCCMIGDNYRSDCINAKANGLGTVRIKDVKEFNRPINTYKMIRKLENHEHKSGMSYANYSFMLFKFISSLYSELIKHGDKKVFFLAREGELLKQLFDIYCKFVHEEYDVPWIESDYLYVSRQATYPASLKSLEEETFESLFCQYPQMSIEAFLDNIGFSEKAKKEIEEVFPQNYDKTVENFGRSDNFKELRNNISFQKKYNKIVSEKKELLREYLKQHGFFDGKSVAIVDVGWKGSIQDNLVKCINECIPIRGYYCGLKNNAKYELNNQKYGLIFSEYPYRTNNYNIWSYDANFMERLMTASHASTREYKEREGEIEPIFNEFGSEQLNYEIIKPVQNKIISQFKKCMSVSYNISILSDELEEFLTLSHVRCCCKIYKSNFELQQKLLEGQMENFGYQVKSGDRLKKEFSLKNIMKKMSGNYNLLKNIPLVIRVLNSRKLYFLSLCLIRLEKRKLRKEYIR